MPNLKLSWKGMTRLFWICFLKNSVPVFRRFGLITLEKNLNPRNIVFQTYPRVKARRMDSDSDLGLESMFHEGLQCFSHMQEKSQSFATDYVGIPCNINDGHDKEPRTIDGQGNEASNISSIPDVVHMLPDSGLCEHNVRKSSDDSISGLKNRNNSSDIEEKAKPKRKRKRKRKNREKEDESEEDEIMASDQDGKAEKQNQSKIKQKRKKKNAKTDNVDDDAKLPKKPRPNYFIAVRVSNPAIHSAFKVIQDSIIAKEPLFQPALIPVSTLHITLLVMHLEKEQLPKAIDVLHSCQNELKKIVSNQNVLTMTFHGLGNFRNEVVFGKMNDEGEVSMLQQLAQVIKNGFQSSELALVFDDSSPIIPHLTLMKMSRIPLKKKKKKLKKIPPDTYSSWIDCELGVECFSEVLLCSMNDKKEKDGFYHSLGSVAFTEPLDDSSLDITLSDINKRDTDKHTKLKDENVSKNTICYEKDCEPHQVSHPSSEDSLEDDDETQKLPNFSNNSNIDNLNFETSERSFSSYQQNSGDGSMCEGKQDKNKLGNDEEVQETVVTSEISSSNQLLLSGESLCKGGN